MKMAFYLDGSTKELNEKVYERKTNAISTAFACAGLIRAVKAIEDEGQILGIDTNAGVLQRKAHLLRFLPAVKCDAAACRRIFQGIFGEIQ